jgi:hypothetical protein
MTESFKHFIVEAEDRQSDINRIIIMIQKRMPQLLNTKIYRFGGDDGIEELTNGARGYLYFFGKGKAFRVRVRKHHIEAFDIWKQYTLNGRPDFTMDTKDLTVAQIAGELKKIAQTIKTPKTGTVEISTVAESISIEFNDNDPLLEMAKGVSPDQFLKFAKDAGVNVNDVTFDQIVKIARDNNVGVPNKKWLDGQKIGRGKWTLVPGGASQDGVKNDGGKVEVSAGQKGDPIMYIKVTAQDPDTKKFLPTADNKQAQALYKQIQQSLSADRKPTEEEMRDVDSLYGDLHRLVTMACKGSLRSLLIYGGPGTGKTYTIMQAIKEAGLKKSQDYVKLSGKASAVEIYKTLFMFRKGGMILFDDLDSMWKDKDASNYLKAALDTSPIREISSLSNQMKNVAKMTDEEREEYNDRFDKYLAGEDSSAEDDEEDEDGDDEDGGKKKKSKKEKMKFPSTFDFKGRVVFISNLRKEEFDTAIMSRSAKIDMSLTPAETLKRMRTILPTLGGTDVSVEDKETLIQELLRLNGSGELEAVTMREFIKGLDIVRSGDPNWVSLVKYA